MSYFEVNVLQVRHKTSEGVKEVLNIEHIAIEKGTTYGIVGESGQGKTVLALTILKLLQCPPGEITKGSIMLDGEDILTYSQHMLMHHISKDCLSLTCFLERLCLATPYMIE